MNDKTNKNDNESPTRKQINHLQNPLNNLKNPTAPNSRNLNHTQDKNLNKCNKDFISKISTFTITNKSTYYSTIPYDNNQSVNSINLEENKFKLQYDIAKKEEELRGFNKYERSTSLAVKIDRKKTSKNNEDGKILNLLSNKKYLPYFIKILKKIKERKNCPKTIRKDYLGNEIKKNGKVHKVTFVDSLKGEKKRELVKKIKVESYKKYNKINDEEDEVKDKTSCNCKMDICEIF